MFFFCFSYIIDHHSTSVFSALKVIKIALHTKPQLCFNSCWVPPRPASQGTKVPQVWRGWVIFQHVFLVSGWPSVKILKIMEQKKWIEIITPTSFWNCPKRTALKSFLNNLWTIERPNNCCLSQQNFPQWPCDSSSYAVINWMISVVKNLNITNRTNIVPHFYHSLPNWTTFFWGSNLLHAILKAWLPPRWDTPEAATPAKPPPVTTGSDATWDVSSKQTKQYNNNTTTTTTTTTTTKTNKNNNLKSACSLRSRYLYSQILANFRSKPWSTWSMRASNLMILNICNICIKFYKHFSTSDYVMNICLHIHWHSTNCAWKASHSEPRRGQGPSATELLLVPDEQTVWKQGILEAYSGIKYLVLVSTAFLNNDVLSQIFCLKSPWRPPKLTNISKNTSFWGLCISKGERI